MLQWKVSAKFGSRGPCASRQRENPHGEVAMWVSRKGGKQIRSDWDGVDRLSPSKALIKYEPCIGNRHNHYIIIDINKIAIT